jgi:hypothetical protein
MHAEHGVDKCGANDPCKLKFYIDHINIYLSHYFYISQFAHFIGKFSREHVQILYHVLYIENKEGTIKNCIKTGAKQVSYISNKEELSLALVSMQFF